MTKRPTLRNKRRPFRGPDQCVLAPLPHSLVTALSVSNNRLNMYTKRRLILPSGFYWTNSKTGFCVPVYVLLLIVVELVVAVSAFSWPVNDEWSMHQCGAVRRDGQKTQ